MKFRVVRIDAWRNPDGTWWYNDRHTVGYLEINGYPTPRKIFKAARAEGFLSGESIYSVDSYLEFDGIWTIKSKNTDEPLFDLEELDNERD